MSEKQRELLAADLIAVVEQWASRHEVDPPDVAVCCDEVAEWFGARFTVEATS